jgi:hypothetical protein
VWRIIPLKASKWLLEPGKLLGARDSSVNALWLLEV